MPACWGRSLPFLLVDSLKRHLYTYCESRPTLGLRDTEEDKMDMGLSSWNLEPERDPGHVARQGLARRSREGFLAEVAWQWNEEEVPGD